MKRWQARWLSIALAAVVTWGAAPAAVLRADVIGGSGNAATFGLDIVRRVWCDGAQGISGAGDSALDEMINVSLQNFGPMSSLVEFAHDTGVDLGGAAVGSYLQDGLAAYKRARSDYLSDPNNSGIDATNIQSWYKGFANYAQTEMYNSFNDLPLVGRYAGLEDAAVAGYGALQGVPDGDMSQWVANNRYGVLTDPAKLRVGLKVLEMEYQQGLFTAQGSAWTDSNLLNWYTDTLGDFFPYGGAIYGTYKLSQPCDTSTNTFETRIEAAHDPNSIGASPQGAGTGNWIAGGQPLTYVVQFENDPTATAAAVNIRIIVPLDPNLDPTTLVPTGSSFGQAEMAWDATGHNVVWTLPDINLPPDTNPPAGQGWVSFRVAPRSGLATGTVISESAQVYFDYNPPVQTATITRTIDATAPTVAMASVAGSQQAGTVGLSWTGASQAGISRYMLYSEVDGGALSLSQALTGTSEAFQVRAGHSYGFAVQAVDVAGLSSPTPTAAQVHFSVPAATGGAGATVAAPAATGSAGAPANPSATSGSSVGPSGGLLQSSDGSLRATVPAGAIDPGQSLTVSTSGTAPSGAPPLPAGFSPASPYITLSGASLGQPVVATIRDTAAPGQLATVFAGGAWHYLPTSVGSDGALRVYVNGPDTLVVLASSPQFPDVPQDHWARGPIRTLVAAGIASGFPDGSFRPGATVTRAQFVKLVDLTLGLPVGAKSNGFADVAPTDWFSPYVAAAVHSGLVQGTAPETFSPNAPLTREQMAVLLARAMKLTGGGTPTFTDAADIAPWARAAVAAAVGAHYLSGFPDGSFEPLAPATRAQAAQVLATAISGLAPPTAS